MDLAGRSHHLIEIVTAHHLSEQDHAREQAQPACSRHHRRHTRTAAGVGQVIPIRNQHEGAQAGELPEQHELDQIPGEHHAQHGAHERHQEGEEPRHRIRRRHVIARVHDDQRADERHERGEHPGHAIQAQTEREPILRQPCQRKPDHLSRRDLRVVAHQDAETAEGHGTAKPRFPVAGVRRHARGTQAGQERQQQDQHQPHDRPLLFM